MPTWRLWLPIAPVHVLVLLFQLQPFHSKPCPASNAFPHSGESWNSANAQQGWGTFQRAWALLYTHLTQNSATAHTVSPTPFNDTLLLPSLLSTNNLDACPCIEPHIEPEVLASRGTELNTKTTQLLLERQLLCLTSPNCAYTQMKRWTGRLRGNCCYLHIAAQGFLNGRPKWQEAKKKAGLPLHQSEITSVWGTKDPTGQVERHWATNASHTCKCRTWDPCASTWQCWRQNRSSLSAVIWMLLALNFISPMSCFMSRGIPFLKHF